MMLLPCRRFPRRAVHRLPKARQTPPARRPRTSVDFRQLCCDRFTESHMTHISRCASGLQSFLVVMVLITWSPNAAWAQLPIDPGTLGGDFSAATDISDSGQVVGSSFVSEGTAHAFSRTAAGGLIDLDRPDSAGSLARAVNNRGQVVGDLVIANPTFQYKTHAFSWTKDGGMRDLGTLGGGWSEAVAVNDRGEVIGQSETSDGSVHAFRWTVSEGMIDLSTLGGGHTFASAINQHGQVIGSSFIPSDNVYHAFSWTRTGGMSNFLHGSDEFSEAIALNNNGQVVGQTSVGAFSYTPKAGLVNLGSLSRVKALSMIGVTSSGSH